MLHYVDNAECCVTKRVMHRFQIASFSPSTLESSVFKLLHSGERFQMAPFLVIVFGVVMSTIAVSGAKQLRFRLKTDQCRWGLRIPFHL